MTNRFKIHLISFSLLFLFLPGCKKNEAPYRGVAEDFIKTYYLQIDPKGALNFARGPAADKLHREMALLSGVPASKPQERPQMKYKIRSCRSEQPDEAHCDYELEIRTERLIQRRGRLALHQEDGHWWVIQFIEAESTSEGIRPGMTGGLAMNG